MICCNDVVIIVIVVVSKFVKFMCIFVMVYILIFIMVMNIVIFIFCVYVLLCKNYFKRYIIGIIFNLEICFIIEK